MEGVGEAAGVGQGVEMGTKPSFAPGLARHADERMERKRKGPDHRKGVSLIVTPASLVIIVS
jgi:hypothetical protein